MPATDASACPRSVSESPGSWGPLRPTLIGYRAWCDLWMVRLTALRGYATPPPSTRIRNSWPENEGCGGVQGEGIHSLHLRSGA